MATAKQIASAKKNLETWKKAQELKAKLSDNREMITVGFVMGFTACFIASVIVYTLFK